METFTKIGTDWIINSNVIQEIIEKNPISEEKLIIIIKEYILEKLASNKNIIKNVLKRSENEYVPDFVFYIQLNPESTLIEINIKIEEVIQYYNDNKKNLKWWQKRAYSKLINNTSNEYLYNMYSSKKVIGKLTYKDLFEILKSSPENINYMIQTDNFKGINGKTIYKTINNKLYNGFTFKEELLKIFNISENEREIINNNIKRINYEYKENITIKEEFREAKNISEQFKLDENLKNKVLENMPNNLNKLQKAYYIYRRLCQMFSYDEDYYCYSYLRKDKPDVASPKIDHSDINRLNNIEPNSEVICTEITMLFSKFLELLELPYQIVDYNDRKNIDYKNSHMKVNFKIDDVIIEADAGHGLQKSDMSMEKSYGKVSNFRPKKETPLRIINEIEKQLRIVDEHFEKSKEQIQFQDALEIYENKYQRDNNISIKERITMIQEIINKSNLRYLDIMNLIKRLQKRMFKEDQDVCNIEFIVNKKPIKNDKTYELAIVIIYNDKDINMLPETNKFIVITSDKNNEELNFEEIKERFLSGEYAFTGKTRENIYRKWVDEDEIKNRAGHKI